jgi:hypothetical protein
MTTTRDGTTEVQEMHRTTLEFPADQAAKLAKIAKAQHRTVSAQHRVIIEQYLDGVADNGLPK